MQETLMQIIAEKIKNKEEAALVMITKEEGSCPRGIGSMMVVDMAGNIIGGTIGGGEVEEKARQDAVDCIKKGIPRTISYQFNPTEEADSLSMICGGNIEVFIKVFKNADKLLIVGAGHVGLSLYKFAKLLGYYVTIIDNREDFMNKERFPEADQLICGDIFTELQKQYIDETTSVVIITHGHLHDEIALEAVVHSSARYIGMIGSRKKISIVYNNLENKGIARESLQKVYSPVGLDIGGETRAEVALSIISQMQAVKYGCQGGFIQKEK
jgi:xanthine dehydrogenase accessory factor